MNQICRLDRGGNFVIQVRSLFFHELGLTIFIKNVHT